MFYLGLVFISMVLTGAVGCLYVAFDYCFGGASYE